MPLSLKAQRLIEKECLERTGVLNLNNLGLSKIPEKVAKLTWLSALNIGNGDVWNKNEQKWEYIDTTNIVKNTIQDIPESIKSLKKLEIFNFTDTDIKNLSFLSELSQLKFLKCDQTNVNNLAPLSNSLKLQALICDQTVVSDLSPLSGLSQLQTLKFSYTNISDLSPLSNLPQLQTLQIINTSVNDLTPLRSLSKLQTLQCDQTPINDLSPLSGLLQLQTLKLSQTNISDLAPLRKLSKLKLLVCEQTNVNDVGPLSELSMLRGLYLSSTKIRDLSPISDLLNLIVLTCSNTNIHDLSPLSNLKRLNILWFNNTAVSDLSPIHKILKPSFLAYDNCPLIIPPIEFANKGDQAIVEYFDQINDTSTPLNELKIIFLGEGASGKTSLIKRIRGKKFNSKEDQTHGIRIRKTKFDIDGDSITAHLWDFGGQEVMHATHQFFLSKRCIYVLVLNSRTDDKAEYWLKHANSFGGDSPVLVVLNKIDENPSFDVNRKILNEKYPQINGYFPLSCQSEQGIDDFKQALLKQMAQSDTRRTPFPDSWLEVKNQFECMNEDYIESNKYKDICEEKGLDKPISQDVLLQFLHDLGMVINFRQLQNFDTQILNPLWLTNGVYRIINSEHVIENKGVLHEDEFDQVINDPRYKKKNTSEKDYEYPRDKLSYIVRIMQEFELCYPLDHESYVIPQLLPVAEPDFIFEGASIHFVMEFPEFLPDSVFPRLMVKLHDFIDDGLHWRTGMVLFKPLVFDAKARIRADREDKKITIDVCGDKPRRLLSFIRATLKEIIDDFSNLQFKEMIAIPNDQDLIILREYNELVGLEEMKETDVAIVELRQRVSINDILDGVEEPSMRDKAAQTPIKAFISYSHLDQGDGLPALKSALAAQRRLDNLTLWSDHAIDAGDTWEKEIFDQLESADIVLCLISQDFINSEFCHRELEKALGNHHKGEQIVVPIQWRSCDWDDLPISKLQGASTGWIKSASDLDIAWTDVAKKLKPVIQKAKKRRLLKNSTR